MSAKRALVDDRKVEVPAFRRSVGRKVFRRPVGKERVVVVYASNFRWNNLRSPETNACEYGCDGQPTAGKAGGAHGVVCLRTPLEVCSSASLLDNASMAVEMVVEEVFLEARMEDDDFGSRPPLRQIKVSQEVIVAFEAHADHLRERKRQRASELQLRSHLEADQAVVISRHDAGDSERVVDEDQFGVWKPGDQFLGDVCLRTLHDLLLKIDREGCELRFLSNVSSACFPSGFACFRLLLLVLLTRRRCCPLADERSSQQVEFHEERRTQTTVH